MSIAISRKLFGVSGDHLCQWYNMFEIITSYKQIYRSRINFRDISADISYIPFSEYFVTLFLDDFNVFFEV